MYMYIYIYIFHSNLNGVVCLIVELSFCCVSYVYCAICLSCPVVWDEWKFQKNALPAPCGPIVAEYGSLRS